MIRRGEQVEVLNTTKGTLEDSWHPARIVGRHGDVCTVMYDGHANGVVEERVLVRCIRPRPPLVEFSNWSHGDLVHVFDDSAWKLATVLQVLDKKQFLVRVIGSMQDLKLGAARMRVRHCWQDDQWVVVGKGPSNLDVKRPFILRFRNIVSDSQTRQRNHRAARRSTYKKSHNAPSRAVKRKAPGTLDQAEAQRGLMKISRTVERSSLIQTEACAGTGMRSRVTEQEQESMSRPPATNATPREAQNERREDSGSSSSVGSCSINSNFSSHHHCPAKRAARRCQEDVCDAESCTPTSPEPRKQTAGIMVTENRRGALPDRPAPGCSLVLRFRIPDPLLGLVALWRN
uniref:Agenet domain-containing protein n=1 Tax=Kalanchoe fedtschenkoi TaxID=63787 RepID=A0A7N0U6S7_KALFE